MLRIVQPTLIESEFTLMKTRMILLVPALALAAALTLASTAEAETYRGRPGSSMKIDGTSNVHDWTVESKLVAGTLELPADYNKTGKIDASADVMVSVRSLKSYKKAMDEVMHNAMKASEHPKVSFTLKQLVGKGDGKFEATGDLSAAGVTKEVTFPVTIEPQGEKQLVVKGELKTKMTEFGIEPPAPKAAGGLISTGDDIVISFEWVTQKV